MTTQATYSGFRIDELSDAHHPNLLFQCTTTEADLVRNSMLKIAECQHFRLVNFAWWISRFAAQWRRVLQRDKSDHHVIALSEVSDELRAIAKDTRGRGGDGGRGGVVDGIDWLEAAFRALCARDWDISIEGPSETLEIKANPLLSPLLLCIRFTACASSNRCGRAATVSSRSITFWNENGELSLLAPLLFQVVLTTKIGCRVFRVFLRLLRVAYQLLGDLDRVVA